MISRSSFFALIREASSMTEEEKEMVYKKIMEKITTKMSTLELVIQLSKLLGGVIIIVLLTLIYLK